MLVYWEVPLSSEVWKTIPSYPDFEVSSMGRIRRLSGRLMSLVRFNNGYLYAQTQRNNRRIAISSHRAVCEAFHGLPPSGACVVRHLDGVRCNNCPENLRWGTEKENAADRRRHGTERMCDAHNMAKIDRHTVIAIFVLRRRGMSGDEIGLLFDISADQVNRIINRASWSDVAVPQELVEAAHLIQQSYRAIAPSQQVEGHC